MRVVGALAIAICCLPAPSTAQQFDGYVFVMADVLPAMRQGAAAEERVVELRSRVFADYRRDIGSRMHVTVSGFAEGLVRDRGGPGTTRAAIARPHEVSVDARWSRADLRVGFSRVVWGRLDEFLPTDVVNPRDLTRFFLEGRSEDRMPVGMVRARWLPSEKLALEGLYVPVFRAGRYDQLDEAAAPFNIGPGPGFGIERLEPRHTLRNAQGGVRASATSGRVDWSVSAYRGFEPLPLYQLGVTLQERFPRFTMIGGDFETVRGLWGVRGEVAAFVERSLQAMSRAQIVQGHAVEAGLGLDRKAGAFRVSGNLVLSVRGAAAGGPAFSPANRAEIDSRDVTLVASIDRSFARETRAIRAVAVINPGEHSAFTRVIGSVSLRDNVSLDASAGLFAGDGSDVLSRLADRDFLYARLKVFF